MVHALRKLCWWHLNSLIPLKRKMMILLTPFYSSSPPPKTLPTPTSPPPSPPFWFTWSYLSENICCNKLALITSKTQKQSKSVCIVIECYRYGRYRPSSNLLSRKVEGWQKMWWHYAQASVLSDVRKKLKRTSWTYFGQRL